MQQLGELQTNAKQIIKQSGGRITVAAVLLQPKDPTPDAVREKTGFDGPVLLDEGKRGQQAFGAGFGSVVIIDRQGVVRFHAPGTKYKRPRVERVHHALTAIVERDRDPDAVGRALEELGASRVSSRQRALTRLAELEAVEHREEIESLLAGDPSAKARVAAAEALAELRDPAAAGPLARAAAADGDASVRAASGRALLSIGDDFQDFPGPMFRPEYTHAVVDALAENADLVLEAANRLLAEKKASRRRIGARLLWRLGDDRSLPTLIGLARDRDEEVRYAAVSGLATHWRDDEDVRALAEKRAKDSSARIRQLAKYTLEGPKGKVRD